MCVTFGGRREPSDLLALTPYERHGECKKVSVFLCYDRRELTFVPR